MLRQCRHQHSIYRFRGRGAYTRGGLEIVSPEVRGALLGLWQGVMGSVMGHSHHRRPPHHQTRDRLEKQDKAAMPQNRFGLGFRAPI